MAKRQNPIASVMEMLHTQETNGREEHPLSVEAQAENLRAAWAHYTAPKIPKSGELYRERQGLAVFRDNPVLLFVRMLNPSLEQDREMALDTLRNQRWNKVDCLVARNHDEGSITFYPHDSDLLEPLPEDM